MTASFARAEQCLQGVDHITLEAKEQPIVGITRMEQAIVGYHQDSEPHWVAELACGHFRHVRHAPPWTNRPWVTTEAGRLGALGLLLECRKCDAGAPPDATT